MTIRQFRSRNVCDTQEVPSYTAQGPTTPVPPTRQTQFMYYPIRRKEETQRQLQERVSGKGEPFSSGPCTDSVATIPSRRDQTTDPIETRQQTNHSCCGAIPRKEDLFEAIEHHKQDYKVVPEHIYLSIEFAQYICTTMQDVLRQDKGTLSFQGDVPLSFLPIPSSIIICESRYTNSLKRTTQTRQLGIT